MTDHRAGGRARLLLLVCLAGGLAILSPAVHLPGPVGAHAVAPAGHEAASPPPPSDGDTRYESRVFPLRVLSKGVPLRDSTARTRGGPGTVASAAILVDLDRAEVLWARDPHARRPPASTAKMMSALVALENFPPDRLLRVTPAAADSLTVETRMELLPGEQFTARELLSGMLMISANDATRAFAEGSVGMGDYVAAMNRQATAMGLRDSHFVNPVGFPDDPEMYSSAYDLASIAALAYREFPLFGELTATRSLDLPGSSLHRDYRMHNINRLPDVYGAAVGTKSGFTDEAGPCLVAMAVRGNHRLLSVLLNAPRMFDQTRALLEWGFAQEGLPAAPPAPPNPPWVPAISH